MFAPDAWLLARRWPGPRAGGPLAFALLLACLAAPNRAGMFGVSIPANYGSWFTSIHRLYVANQDLAANARKLYTAFLAVSSALDALEGMNAAAQGAFRERWRRNLQVLLEANIWFTLDEQALAGDRSVNQLVQQLLGLQVDAEGRASIEPGAIRTLALSLAADRDRWARAMAAAPLPALPGWLTPREEQARIARALVDNPVESGFDSYRRRLERAAAQRFADRVGGNPLAYLECAGRAQCWSPFHFDGPAHARDWPETLALMVDRGHRLHAPLPLPEERVAGGALDIDQYLHRRVCAALWRGLGAELRGKLTRLRALFQRRCRELASAARDVENLVRFLQDSLTPLSEWRAGDAASLALVAATAMSIRAGGLAKTQARMRSFIDGYIAKKVEIALERAREVKERARALDAIFADLLAQIKEAGKPEDGETGADRLALRGLASVSASFRTNAAPPHAYVSSSMTLERLSAAVAAACRPGGAP